MADESAERIPPYVPWRTFESYIESLKTFGNHLPNVIDRDSMRNYSGAMQSWLLGALRSLKMIDADGVPRPRLKQVVQAAPEQRKILYKQIIDAEYAFLKDINLPGATPKQLETAFESTGASGDTVRKCMAFFVNFAKAADLSLSPLLEKVRRRPSTNGYSTNKRRVVSLHARDATPNDSDEDDEQPDGKTPMKRTLTLPQSRGTITLIGNFDPFSLTAQERDFVYGLIDLMNDFELQNGGPRNA